MDTPGLDIEALREADGNRDARGRFTPGHLVGLKHGLRVSPDHHAIVALHAERVEALATDRGGWPALSVTERSLVGELARLQIITDSLGADLIAEGVITAKGRIKSKCTLYLQVLAAQQRLAERLGLERRAAPTGPAHLREYLEAGR